MAPLSPPPRPFASRSPARASTVRIGTEKVRSLPYRRLIASASGLGSRLPAARRIQLRTRSSAAPYGESLVSATVRAAQHRAVVLMLLGLSVVSPQPPSPFWVLTSHAPPPRASAPSAGRGRWRSTSVSAMTAVAVESEDDDSLPAQ